MDKWIYKLKITLLDTKPLIWRRILVRENVLLSDLHKIIQTTMGWTNSHLHHFIKDNTFYTVKMADDDFWDELNNVDYKGIRINEILQFVKNTIIYEYDFGDGWMHEILLEKFVKEDKNVRYPVCIAGKYNCPPEDVGGTGGYMDLIRIMKNPNHKEYESYIKWLGGKYDYTDFDINNVNKELTKRNFGIKYF